MAPVFHSAQVRYVARFHLEPQQLFSEPITKAPNRNAPVFGLEAPITSGTAVALKNRVGRLERPGSPLWCSAGASALPTFPAWRRESRKTLPAPPCTAHYIADSLMAEFGLTGDGGLLIAEYSQNADWGLGHQSSIHE